jgi:transcriptional regulator with XRE-family HTH domain
MSFEQGINHQPEGRHLLGARLSASDWEARIGEQLRRSRLDADLDQAQLAARADVSIGALRNLERGNGSTLRTLVRVARALGLESWLNSLAPAAAVSPIEVLRSGRPQRKRVYRARSSGRAAPEDARGSERD